MTVVVACVYVIFAKLLNGRFQTQIGKIDGFFHQVLLLESQTKLFASLNIIIALTANRVGLRPQIFRIGLPKTLDGYLNHFGIRCCHSGAVIRLESFPDFRGELLQYSYFIFRIKCLSEN